eukprot:426310-Pyramimonas_sp.AAC.1
MPPQPAEAPCRSQRQRDMDQVHRLRREAGLLEPPEDRDAAAAPDDQGRPGLQRGDGVGIVGRSCSAEHSAVQQGPGRQGGALEQTRQDRPLQESGGSEKADALGCRDETFLCADA